MPFSIRPFRRFPVECAVTYNAGPFIKLPLVYCSEFGQFFRATTEDRGLVFGEVSFVTGNNQQCTYVSAPPLKRYFLFNNFGRQDPPRFFEYRCGLHQKCVLEANHMTGRRWTQAIIRRGLSCPLIIT